MIKSRRRMWAGHAAHIEEESSYKALVGRTRYRWEDNITVDLTEMGWEDVDWTVCLRIGSSLYSQQPIVVTLMASQVP
jgi:hypothetical protein